MSEVKTTAESEREMRMHQLDFILRHIKYLQQAVEAMKKQQL